MLRIREVTSFLRLAFMAGWRPMWRLGVNGVGLTAVGAVVFAVHANPVWLLAALLVVLLAGAFFAFSEASQRARTFEWKAARTDLLEKRVTELGKELAVSQAQYKVLRDFKPPSAA